RQHGGRRLAARGARSEGRGLRGRQRRLRRRRPRHRTAGAQPRTPGRRRHPLHPAASFALADLQGGHPVTTSIRPASPLSSTQGVWLVAERELSTKLRSKAYLISTAILLLLALAGVIWA